MVKPFNCSYIDKQGVSTDTGVLQQNQQLWRMGNRYYL